MQENNQTSDTPNTSTDTNPTPVATDATESSSVVSDVTATPVTTEVADVMPQADTVVAEVVETVVETPVVSDITTEPAAIAEAVATASAKKQIFVQYGIATLVVLVMGAGLAYALEQQGRIDTGIFDKISAVISPAPAAAIVNGAKISKADYEKNLTQLQAAAEAQGAVVTDAAVQAEIKKQAIDVLVNTELLRQAAYDEGALVTDDQIEARYKEIVESLGGVEQLNTKMAELGITEPDLRKDIEGEILIQGHLSKAVDTSKITITEKELTDAYAQISGTAAAGVTVPPLAEIKTQLEAQLRTNKEQELVNAYITKIREGAAIEVLI